MTADVLIYGLDWRAVHIATALAASGLRVVTCASGAEEAEVAADVTIADEPVPAPVVLLPHEGMEHAPDQLAELLNPDALVIVRFVGPTAKRELRLALEEAAEIFDGVPLALVSDVAAQMPLEHWRVLPRVATSFDEDVLERAAEIIRSYAGEQLTLVPTAPR